jgi:hypothetical protein
MAERKKIGPTKGVSQKATISFRAETEKCAVAKA